MSGLCGICDFESNRAARDLEVMLSATSLPGEFGCDSLVRWPLAMGIACRWPGQQMASVSDVQIAVDTDLCNIAELRAEVSRQGLNASQTSIGELLIKLYLIKGISFVEELHGAFAFALWDGKARRLIAGIDRLGIKNLYWSYENNRFLFGSRASAIATVQEKGVKVNPAAIVQCLLFSVVTAPHSVYAGIEKLCPGVVLIYENNCVQQKQYWKLDYTETGRSSVSSWAERLQEAMRSAVSRHIDGVAEATSGAYLSGGTDSSSVVAFMSEKQQSVSTFSISFEEGKYNEIDFARTTAAWFRTRHYERRLSPRDAEEAIPKIIKYYDEPFANSSAIGAYHCALLARENGVDTLLAGDGGDELFAGNERYASDKRFALYHNLPSWARSGFIEPICSLLPNDDGWLSLPRRYIRRAQISNPRRMFSYNFFLSMEPREIFEREFLEEVPPERWMEIAERHFHEAIASSELNRLLNVDVKITLADNDLRKVAGTAEIAGVRVRFPLLDFQLAEFAARIPTKLKLKGFEKRFIFKQAMKAVLPAKVLHKRKHGFGVPLALWFLKEPRLNSLMLDVLSDSRTQQRGYLRSQFFDKLINLHRREHPGYYGEIIWCLVALELWHREHFEHVRGAAGAK